MDSSLQFIVRSSSGTDPDILRLLEKNRGGYIRKGGILYYLADGLVYSCEDSPEGEKLLGNLSEGACAARGGDPEEQIWRDLLAGKTEAMSAVRLKAADSVPRCVILFRLPQDAEGFSLTEMIPVDETDRVTGLGGGEAALIMNMKKRSADEAFEYAAAAAETMESEAGISCFAGIGRTVRTLADLPSSCLEARAAIGTGIRHRMPGRVFAWEKMTLERMADLIPPGSAAAFRKEIIPPQAEKILNEETLETVRVFFQNDMNLSTTARHLFIHRNTLLYRMEKIRKATGLDLRRFEDAVVFRMILDMDPGQE